MAKIHTEEDHCKNILEKLWQRCKNEDLCDVVLIAGPNKKRIPAHRLILSTTSKYFRWMFSSPTRESTEKKIELPSLDGDVLQSLVEYCYKGRVVISEDIVVEMLKIADMLLLRNVVNACANFLEDHLHPSNCLGIALLAELYRCETLLQKAKDCAFEDFGDVRKTDEFFNLNATQLSELLASDEIYAPAEGEVFESLVSWIKYNPVEREKYKEELLGLVRMPLLEQSFLDEQVKPIFTSAEALRSHLLSNPKNCIPRNLTRTDEFLLAITRGRKCKSHIHYYCPLQHKWLKWLKNLECRGAYDFVVIPEHFCIVGGFESWNKTGIYLNLRTMTSHKINPMIEHRINCHEIVLKGFLYMVGGRGQRSAEIWSPKTNSWKHIASMSTDRSDFGIASLNGKIYVIGGMSKNNSRLNTAECFDPDKNVWTNIASMSTDRIYFGIATVNKKIYVVGGVCENRRVNTVECYDPGRNVWTDIECMHHPRSHLKVAVLNGQLYASGGVGGEETIERYDPKTKDWTVIRTFIENGLNRFPRCITFRNKVVVCYTDRFEEYNSETNEWKTTPTFNGKLIKNMAHIFSYSGKLRLSEFVEN